jgi:hypothetical protein
LMSIAYENEPCITGTIFYYYFATPQCILCIYFIAGCVILLIIV